MSLLYRNVLHFSIKALNYKRLKLTYSCCKPKSNALYIHCIIKKNVYAYFKDKVEMASKRYDNHSR